MSRLPFIAQRMFNQPLCLHPSRAPMLIAALHQRLGISSLAMEAPGSAGELVIDESVMDAMAEAGKKEAGVRQARRNGRVFEEENNVAIIPVEGTLVNANGLDPYSGMTGYDGIENKLIAAEQDDAIKAKALVIDSGGGDVSGLFDLADLIWSLNAQNGGKPTYAIIADHAYSAAYAIASACDKVWCPRTGGAGSVGVITMHADFSQNLANEGIKVTIIRAGKDKARAQPYEPLPPETLAHIQGQCDEIRELFVETVARNMGISKKSVLETEGLDYMGVHAKAKGFVNFIGSKHSAWDALMSEIS